MVINVNIECTKQDYKINQIYKITWNKYCNGEYYRKNNIPLRDFMVNSVYLFVCFYAFYF